MIYTVDVEWAHDRPPRQPNLSWSAVIVSTDGPTDATLCAAQIVACRHQCIMPTRTVIRPGD